MLLTERVESIVDSIKKLDKLSASVLLHYLVKSLNIDKDHSYLTLGFGEVFLSILNARANQAWNQNVDDRLKLLELFDVSKLSDKADFLFDFVPISVISPEENVQCHRQSLPHQLYRTILRICDILNRGQADVQESNSWRQANQAHEKDRIESDQVRKGDRVQELDLD